MEQENIKFSFPSLSLYIKNIQATKEHPLRDMHFHKALELVFVHSGTIICSSNGSEYTLNEGHILLINENLMHRLQSPNQSNITYMQINIDKYSNAKISDGGYLDEFVGRNTGNKLLILKGENELTNIFKGILKEYKKRDDCYEDYIKAYIFMLVAFMRRNRLLTASTSFNDPKKLNQIIPIVNYIDKNYNSKISLYELGEIIGCDKYRLCRLFKQVTSHTIFDYLTFVRLLNAKDLLINSEKSISEIAFDCGFSSIQYFNRVFKENHGYSPSFYKDTFVDRI